VGGTHESSCPPIIAMNHW